MGSFFFNRFSTACVSLPRSTSFYSPFLKQYFLAAKVKTHELRGKSKEDLTKQLSELKSELVNLRVAKVTGGAPSKLAKMYVISN